MNASTLINPRPFRFLIKISSVSEASIGKGESSRYSIPCNSIRSQRSGVKRCSSVPKFHFLRLLERMNSAIGVGLAALSLSVYCVQSVAIVIGMKVEKISKIVGGFQFNRNRSNELRYLRMKARILNPINTQNVVTLVTLANEQTASKITACLMLRTFLSNRLRNKELDRAPRNKAVDSIIKVRDQKM